MKVTGRDDGSFIIEFKAEELELGLAILSSIQPADEDSQVRLQESMDELVACNNMNPYRTIN